MNVEELELSERDGEAVDRVARVAFDSLASFSRWDRAPIQVRDERRLVIRAAIAELRRIEAENADTVGVVIPPEPPNGSVVLLANGAVAQRRGAGWRGTGSASVFTAVSWPHIVVDYGPVRVIHRAETG